MYFSFERNNEKTFSSLLYWTMMDLRGLGEKTTTRKKILFDIHVQSLENDSVRII